MSAPNERSDSAVLSDLGTRLSGVRISRGLTQAQLAHDAGVSKRTVERIEAGESAQLTSFLRILRALGLLNRMEQLLPPPLPAPMDLLRRAGKMPQRARGTGAPSGEPWTWADED